MARFDDFGFPFVLYQGPVETADVTDTGTCAACGDRARFLFAGACYGCFRAGRADHAIDTELGVVSVADAERGMTQGVPLDDPGELAGYELVQHKIDPAFPRERLYSVKLPVEELRELARTPRYQTAHGERWLFCCGRACAFIGELTPDLAREAADGAELVERLERGTIAAYAFRCRTCNRLRVHHEDT